MSGPAVSVVLPFRHAAPYIEGAIGSVLSQTLEGLELVMVDDRADAATRRAAAGAAAGDPRARVVPCEGLGLVDALQTGLRCSSGTWIARMDADDLCRPERLARQLEVARREGERCVVTCMVESFPPEMVSGGLRAYEGWLNSLVEPDEIARDIFVESPVPHPTAFFHREAVLSEGGYAERELPEDYELWLRLHSRGFSFRRVPEVLLRWRERPDRLSRTSGAYSQTAFYRLRARYLAGSPLLRCGRVVMAGSGQAARRLGRELLREGVRIEAFVDPSPGRAGASVLGRPVLHLSALSRLSGLPVVAATRSPAAREEARRYLSGIGLREPGDFVVSS